MRLCPSQSRPYSTIPRNSEDLSATGSSRRVRETSRGVEFSGGESQDPLPRNLVVEFAAAPITATHAAVVGPWLLPRRRWGGFIHAAFIASPLSGLSWNRRIR